jgi:HD-like signal output (HDOD) protein
MANYQALKKAYAPHVDIDDSSIKPLENTPERLLAVVLKDRDGYVQAIFRRKDMLDIEMLNLEYSRELKAISQSAMRSLKKRLDIDVMQPWPLNGGKWMTVIDRDIMGLSHVDIAIDDASMVRVRTDQFLEAMSKSDRKKITKTLDTVSPNCGEDDVDACILKFTHLKIKRRLDETIELPPLSGSARRLMDLRTDPNANLMDLVEVIENDPSLTASILRWSKSSFYKNAGDVADVKDAIGRVMGFDLVMNLAMGLTLGGVIEKPKEHPDGFMEYWQQAIWMSQISAVVTLCIPAKDRPKIGISYLLGILHNFGYLVLNHVFPSYFKLICRHWEANRHLDTYVVEKRVLGITREEVAAKLFECWEMPPELIQGVRHQKNETYDGEYRKYVLLLSACRSLMSELGLPLGYEIPSSNDYLEELGVDREKLEERLDAMMENKQHIDSLAALL